MSINLHVVGRLSITPVLTVLKLVPRSAFLADTNCCSFVCAHPYAADGTTPILAVIPKLSARIGNAHCGILVLSIEVKTVSATCSLCRCILVTISNPIAHKNHKKAPVTIFVATNALDFTELQYCPTRIIEN